MQKIMKTGKKKKKEKKESNKKNHCTTVCNMCNITKDFEKLVIATQLSKMSLQRKEASKILNFI